MNFLHGLVGPGNKFWVLFGMFPVPTSESLEISPPCTGELLVDRLGRRVRPIREHARDVPADVVGYSLEETAEGRRNVAVHALIIPTKMRRLLVHRLLPRRWWLRATAAAPLGGQADADPPGRRTAGGVGHGRVMALLSVMAQFACLRVTTATSKMSPNRR